MMRNADAAAGVVVAALVWAGARGRGWQPRRIYVLEIDDGRALWRALAGRRPAPPTLLFLVPHLLFVPPEGATRVGLLRARAGAQKDTSMLLLTTDGALQLSGRPPPSSPIRALSVATHTPPLPPSLTARTPPRRAHTRVYIKQLLPQPPFLSGLDNPLLNVRTRTHTHTHAHLPHNLWPCW
jgi:hypothetical protein